MDFDDFDCTHGISGTLRQAPNEDHEVVDEVVGTCWNEFGILECSNMFDEFVSLPLLLPLFPFKDHRSNRSRRAFRLVTGW